jgi:serine/threonine protein kinase
MLPIKNELKLKSYLNDALEGINYLHNSGFVHTDIRPEKLLSFDFGEGVRDVN